MKGYFRNILVLFICLFSEHLFAQCTIEIFPDNPAICSGDSITLIAVDDGGNGLFEWSPAVTLSSSTGQVIIAKPATTTTYTISQVGCDTVFITVTVNPLPTVNPVANVAYCNGELGSEIIFSPSGPEFFWHSKNDLNIGFGVNGFGNIPEFNAFNDDTLPVIDTIIVSATENGCTGAEVSFTITVNPIPRVTEVPDTLTLCDKEKFDDIIFKSSTPGVIFKWQSNPDIGFGTSGTGDITGVKVHNSGTDSIVATITVSASLGSCQGPDTTFTMTVYPLPAFTSNTDTVVCDNILFEYSATATAGATFSWKRNAVTGISNAPDSANTNFISETLHNTTDLPIIVQYEFTLKPAFNTTKKKCNSIDTLYVTVNPTPKVNSVTDRTYCNGESVSGISFSSLSPDSEFYWTSNLDIGFGTNGTGNIPAFNAINTGTSILTATINVFAIANGCEGPDSSFTISVIPKPVLTSSKNESLCDSNMFVYDALSFPGSSFSWYRNADSFNQSSSDTTSSISEVLINQGDTSITVHYYFAITLGYGCIGYDTLKVTIYPSPEVTQVNSFELCSGMPYAGITFSSQTPDSVFHWTSTLNIGFGISGTDSIPSFIGGNSGVATIVDTVKVYATSNGCTGPISEFTISVLPGPAFTSSKQSSICSGQLFTYGATSSTPGTIFSWERDADSVGNAQSTGSSEFISEILYNTSDSTKKVYYYFQLTPGGGCIGYDTLVVDVYPVPTLSGLLSLSTCDGVLFVYHAQSNTPGTIFSWYRPPVIGINGDTASSGNSNQVQEVLENNTADSLLVIYDFTLSANGCPEHHDTINVVVYPTPTLSDSLLFTICNDDTFVDTIANNGQFTSFYWERDSTAGITPLTKNGSTNIIVDSLHNSSTIPIDVTYHITLTEANGCTHQTKIVTTVYPTLKLITDTTASVCDSVSFVYLAESTPGVIFSWSRDSVDGISNAAILDTISNLVNETLDNTTDSLVVVTYIFKLQLGSCIYYQNLIDTVYPTPVLSTTTDTSVCDNILFHYAAESPTTGTTFSWIRNSVSGVSNPADTSDSFLINETLNNTTDTPVTVIYAFKLGIGNCFHTENLKVKVNPTPHTLYIPDKYYCHGDSVPGIHFSSNSPGATYTWNSSESIGFGISGDDSIPSFMAQNTGSNPIIAHVTVHISASADNCPGPDSTFDITVNPRPLMISESEISICSGNSLDYDINSNLTNNMLYSWASDPLPVISGNTNHDTSTTHIITDTLINSVNDISIPVVYDISLIYYGLGTTCRTDTTLTVNVNPSPPLPSFTSNLINGTVCGGAENINFNVSFSDTSGNVVYQWSASPDSLVDIGSLSNPNTVLSFRNINGQVEIKVIAYNSSALGSCPDSSSQVFIINQSSDSISERKIILKQPGNLLVYPDNSMSADSGYQWGYDLKINDTLLGPPNKIHGQVYQVFVPDSQYLIASGTELDTFTYCFWVQLRRGSCISKVYYNGPYSHNRIAYCEEPDPSLSLSVYPNPTLGSFNIILSGKVYGNMDEKIYNILGEEVYRTEFLKTQYEVVQRIPDLHLPNGIYSLELLSSDHKRIRARIVISD